MIEPPYAVDDVIQNVERGGDAYALFRVERVLRGSHYLDLVDLENSRRRLSGVDMKENCRNYRKTVLVPDDFDKVKRIRALHAGSRVKHLIVGEIRIVVEVVNSARYYVQRFDKTGQRYRETFGSLQRDYVAYGWGAR